MDTMANAWRRFHGPHPQTTVRRQLPDMLSEIESAIGEFVRASDELIQDFSRVSTERVWVSSRIAWSLMFPYRRLLLRTNPALVEAFRAAVRRVRETLGPDEHAEDEFLDYSRKDFARRESLLDALLSDDSELRLRQLLAAERQAVEKG